MVPAQFKFPKSNPESWLRELEPCQALPCELCQEQSVERRLLMEASGGRLAQNLG